ncbi:four helix bundle protein [Candidatus Berkelbacteria bacterium]|nr:four helix bundle protein [Candidatus Berkelbacteria bacterium]OIP06089.1 MAG: four helix bundle protein [Candidatus Berkelbacteria bacterium CG2_30_43_20]PIU87141.1 MAG: four helix bundle protein [Candidatus Berkelbacteria bacterium CG06_land_8_20_14_3_00_43_10]
MKIEKFEDIVAWQKAKELTIQCYDIFGSLKDYGFRDQILRACVSIMNNIAEGFERRGDKEFKHFLFIAKGSCAEVRSMLYIAVEIGYVNDKEFDIVYSRTVEISKILSGFIKTL